jgi:hypothetical protein
MVLTILLRKMASDLSSTAGNSQVACAGRKDR